MAEAPKFNQVASGIQAARLRPLALDILETARGLQDLSVPAPTQLVVSFERGAEPNNLAAATELAARAFAEKGLPSGKYGNLHSVTEFTPAGVDGLRRRLQDEGVADDVSTILGLVDISNPDQPRVGAIDLARGEITTVSFAGTSKFD